VRVGPLVLGLSVFGVALVVGDFDRAFVDTSRSGVSPAQV